MPYKQLTLLARLPSDVPRLAASMYLHEVSQYVHTYMTYRGARIQNPDGRITCSVLGLWVSAVSLSRSVPLTFLLLLLLLLLLLCGSYLHTYLPAYLSSKRGIHSLVYVAHD